MDELVMERYALSKERLQGIITEKEVPEPFSDFFEKGAGFLLKMTGIMEREEDGLTSEQRAIENRELYQDLFPANYGESYGNPAAAVRKLGNFGQAFSFLYAEMRGAIVWAFEKRIWDLTVLMELFLELYSAFACGDEVKESTVRSILCSYVNDYCPDFARDRVSEILDPGEQFALKIVMESDLTDPVYLYRYGEYVSENEIRTSRFLSSLEKEEVQKIARTFTEGYRQGFIVTGKDLGKKKTVNIRYHLGFERIVREAVKQFEEMGLKSILYRHASHVTEKRNQIRTGYTGATANPQYEYDHRQDAALFLTSDYMKKRLRSLQNAYDSHKELAGVHGGPAVIETFGETPFSPETTEKALSFSDTQQELFTELYSETAQLVNRYIKGDEYSYTIIAYPLPEIGKDYPEIFREIIRINSLDYFVYRRIQQKIIDLMDTCEWAEVKGRNGNRTDLRIHLHTLTDPERQTNFENCVADVNIPVGEVFTSPLLAGTEGTLHVKKVYLEGLLFRDLRLVFENGRVIDYSCSNFDSEEENRKYIEDNIFYQHVNIPMGEFAIGTNTTAYVTARKFGIEDRLPILIAEKMGPHFAVGDTCYSWMEDVPVYNPDGKEIIARENEISALRKEDPSRAYFNCHTDITIPYDELDSVCVIGNDGEKTAVIRKGRFVLEGTEELNEPFREFENC